MSWLVHRLYKPKIVYRRNEFGLITALHVHWIVARLDLTQMSLHISKWYVQFEKPWFLPPKFKYWKQPQYWGKGMGAFKWSKNNLNRITAFYMKNKTNFLYESQHQGKSIMAGQTIIGTTYLRAIKIFGFVFSGFYSNE